jgi:hypothetical protein
MPPMPWWLWALIGCAIAFFGFAGLALANTVRGARDAERRATDAAQELVRMTDDLERRIRTAREETARVEHRIEIVDESRRPATPLLDEFDELDDLDEPRERS